MSGQYPPLPGDSNWPSGDPNSPFPQQDPYTRPEEPTQYPLDAPTSGQYPTGPGYPPMSGPPVTGPPASPAGGYPPGYPPPGQPPGQPPGMPMQPQPPPPSSGSNTWIIAGAIGAVIVVLVAGIAMAAAGVFDSGDDDEAGGDPTAEVTGDPSEPEEPPSSGNYQYVSDLCDQISTEPVTSTVTGPEDTSQRADTGTTDMNDCKFDFDPGLLYIDVFIESDASAAESRYDDEVSATKLEAIDYTPSGSWDQATAAKDPSWGEDDLYLLYQSGNLVVTINVFVPSSPYTNEEMVDAAVPIAEEIMSLTQA